MYWYKDERKPFTVDKGYRSLGSAVHEAIENVLNDSPQLRDQDRLEYEVQQQLDEMDHGVPETMVDDAYSCVANAAKWVSQQDFEVVGVEDEHDFKVSRPDLSIPFKAIMDVTTKQGIIDWKTGNRYESKERLQGAVYLSAYADKYDRIPEYVKFIYLKDREVQTYSRKDETTGHEFWGEDEMPDGWGEVIRIAKKIQRAWREDKWPAKPETAPCHFCDARYWCPEGGYGVDSVDPFKFCNDV